MPCLLKRRGENSPGIIALTNNEVIYGVAHLSERVQRHLLETTRSGEWIYGTHIQGDVSQYKWPDFEWQRFVMWPNAKAENLSEIPPGKILPLNCINFMPRVSANTEPPVWDLCVVSRASSIKRIHETILIIRALMDRKPDLRVTFIVPDNRVLARGEATYEEMGIERSYFELPAKIFSALELEQINFLSTSVVDFGRFPLDDDLMRHVIGRSRFAFLPSHREGTPRTVIEALQLGTPCIVSENLISGINHVLTPDTCVKVVDDVEKAAEQIARALDEWKGRRVDPGPIDREFAGENNREPLKEFFRKLFRDKNLDDRGEWYLDKLHLRLACHGHRHNSQFMHNEELFFDWFEKVQVHDPMDEDLVLGREPLNDAPPAAGSTSLLQRLKRKFA